MLKNILRHTVINLLAFYLTSVYLVPGFKIPLNFVTYLEVVAVFTLLSLIVKPILKIIFLPINFLTLGLFSWLINVLILYFLKALLPNIVFASTGYPSLNLEGFTIPAVNLSSLWTVVLTSFSLTFLSKFLKWLMSK